MAASKMMLMASLTHCRPLTCAATATARLVPRPPDLIKWVRREGGFIHRGVKILPNGAHGLGLVACEEMSKGSLLIALPAHELWAMKLGLKLLQERAKIGSFWWPYISNLPETYNVPIFFSGDDIKNLQYAPLLSQVNKRCRFLLDFEQEVKHALHGLKSDNHPFEGQDIDASGLGWAIWLDIDTPMMLPLIDMCNHSFNPNAQIVQEQDVKNENMLIKVVAQVPIKENDSILINYGCLSNDLFLLDYGFVVTIGGEELVERRLLAALRVLLANDVEMVQRHDLNTLQSLAANAPLGTEIEASAFRTIIALCVIALGHFPTKIMEDESLIKRGVSASIELAIQFRIQKKSVIIDVMRELSRRLKSLLSKNTSAAQS
ncbi:hypothetical protein K2173_009761 [Erythroxylum novogranatense]|uniref:SET domain-containing protein n=1 Tax=Erythroxylum novogranatense TaxID=1862640 RepID=A0AAV8TU57_9ROSI|nr:hypothetical protein K2173_009761 [Erythroxylum novogranatense]